MDEKEELMQELEKELMWVQYRLKMLDIIDAKLLEMKQIAEQAKEGGLNPEELKALNDRINNLAEQVRAIDSENQ